MASKNQTRKRKKYTSGGFLSDYWGDRGGFSSIPTHVCDGPDWISLSFSASKILMIIARVYKGSNNGDLHATESSMAKYGITSSATLFKALSELQEKGLIVKTQQGYRDSNGKRKPNLYALTWLPVDEISQRSGDEWMPKIKGTTKPLRTDFSRQYDGSIKYEVA